MHEIEVIAKNLIAEYGWMFIVGFFGLFFKDTMSNLFQGVMVFLGNDINNDDILYLSGRRARVIRMGIRKTIFYMSDRGTKMIVPNDRLKVLTIEKMLPRNGGKGRAIGPDANLTKQVFDGKEFIEKND